jgi:hypothetical protein
VNQKLKMKLRPGFGMLTHIHELLAIAMSGAKAVPPGWTAPRGMVQSPLERIDAVRVSGPEAETMLHRR